MPKVLTHAQVDAFERDGCLYPVRAMSAERAQHYRRKFDALEARVPDIKKMKTKSHLLCPWVLEIAEDPHILERELLADYPDAEMGQFPMHHVVPRLLGTPGSIRTPAPKLGQHNEEILRSLGLNSSGIENLKKKGIVFDEA